MVRSVITGLLSGTAVSALVLIGASQVAPRVTLSEPPDVTVIDATGDAPLDSAAPEVTARDGDATPRIEVSRPSPPTKEVAPDAVAAPDVATVDATPVAPLPQDAPDQPTADAVVELDLGTLEITAPSQDAPAAPVSDPVDLEAETEVGVLDEVPVDTAPAPPPPTQFASSEPDVLPRLIQPDIEAPEPDTAPAAQPVADTRPPIEAFAADFAPSGDAPRFGLILLDTEDAPALDLTGLTLPVAVALDPLLPDATERMANLRAAGLEVLVLTPLVEGATASDVEVAFQSFFASVSQAVAVMDVPDAVLQGDRQRAEQVVEILKATGHGLLTYDKGLNAILQVAETDAVPALKVTQVFDTGDSDAARMKRFLDQGAFRSGRDGQAVMVGYLRAETLETLSDWAQGNRAASVQMAPVSAILLQK